MVFEDRYEIDFSARNPKERVDKLFHQRWSPRSYEKKEIPLEILNAIFDAARWSPSCSNDQPWLFKTSSNQSEFDLFMTLLEERNQIWAINTSVIGFIFSKKVFSKSGKTNNYAAFDCGAASMAITLQARMFGLYVHTLAGIHKDKVSNILKVPEEDYDTVCGFTIGVLDLPGKLPDDFFKREKPPGRKTLDEIWQHGM